MTKYVKQKGIEAEIVPNQKIQLEETTEDPDHARILAMNKGPILRGTWTWNAFLAKNFRILPRTWGKCSAESSVSPAFRTASKQSNLCDLS